jgi:pimeloyl-ACP methyl ester carboxylesterase
MSEQMQVPVARNGGATLNVERTASSGGPTVALLNMALMNLSSWQPLLESMPEHFGYVRHDYRGTGGSVYDAARDGLPNLDVLAEDFVALLDALAVERVVVIGSSFGSRVALKTALRFPDRVRALCLVDASIGAPPRTKEQEEGMARARAGRAAGGLPELPARPKWFRHADRDLSLQVFLTAKDISQIQVETLSRITQPTMLATGEFDSNLAGSQLIAAQIAGARVTTIAAASHGAITQRPDAVADVIVRFLEGAGIADG